MAAPGAALLFSCFRDRAENPFFTEPTRLLLASRTAARSRTRRARSRSPTAARVEAILLAGGWREIEFEPYDMPMILGVGADPVEDTLAYLTAIGPAARAASALGGDERERFLDRLRGLAERNLHEGIVSLRAAAWIVTARKP